MPPRTSRRASSYVSRERRSGPEWLLHRGCQRRRAAGTDQAEVGAPGDEDRIGVGARVHAGADECCNTGLVTDAIAERDRRELGRRLGVGGETDQVTTTGAQHTPQ